jgi:hypothetical protein
MFDDIFQQEHPEKNGWWINELESLGVDTKNNANELKYKQDNSELVEAIKQTLIEKYKQNYHQLEF